MNEHRIFMICKTIASKLHRKYSGFRNADLRWLLKKVKEEKQKKKPLRGHAVILYNQQ